MDVRTERNAVANLRLVAVAELRRDFVADNHIRETNIRTNHAIFADNRVAFKVSVGVNDCVLSDFNVAVDKSRVGVDNRDAAVHKLTFLAHAEGAICGGELHA